MVFQSSNSWLIVKFGEVPLLQQLNAVDYIAFFCNLCECCFGMCVEDCLFFSVWCVFVRFWFSTVAGEAAEDRDIKWMRNGGTADGKCIAEEVMVMGPSTLHLNLSCLFAYWGNTHLFIVKCCLSVWFSCVAVLLLNKRHTMSACFLLHSCQAV
jgi:hypothetical protein